MKKNNSSDKSILTIGHVEVDPRHTEQPPCMEALPIIPLRDMVLFPGITLPVNLGRNLSLAVAKKAADEGIPVGVFCQLDANDDTPEVSSLHPIGTLAQIIKVIDLPDGQHTALILGKKRIKITDSADNYLIGQGLAASVKETREIMPRASDIEFVALAAEVRRTTLGILRTEGDDTDNPASLSFMIDNVDDPRALVNIVSTHAPMAVDQRQELLATSRLKQRAETLLTILASQEHMAQVRSQVREKAKMRLDEQQRNMILQAQYESLRDELFGSDDDVNHLKLMAIEKIWPAEVQKHFEKELGKLERISPQSPDYSVQHNYLTTLLALPWGKTDPISTDLIKAQEILDSDHYGLEKVKERILEHLAVRMHWPGSRTPIICLVGAPGVGKTSLGKSIAAALGRKYHRISLGGLHDEAEIRGHRRTYIGAMPGRIIDGIRRAGTSNPVLLLDEIDKISADFKGDPSAALLEVLDPEQNSRFHDNFIDIDFDLSDTLFIATANTLSTISQPLLDRMEIIDISGYLLEEKVSIAQRHLLRRALNENGFDPGHITFTPEALALLIEEYTAESGVRQLQKQIESIVRKIVVEKLKGLDYPTIIDADQIHRLLGLPKYSKERYASPTLPGIATGLAWTAVGGEILYIETSASESKTPKLTLTGQLGDVMKESATVALQYVRAHAAQFNIDAETFERQSLHIHVPQGAIPKDGPSAGITILTSIVSALTDRKVKQSIAMTGEITLRGKVLPVGGIKEKILAAKRAGITTIILSSQNRRDISDIQPEYLQGLNFEFVETAGQVIAQAIE